MKKKTIIAFLLLAVGIVLILGTAIAATIYLHQLKVDGGAGIIGGADQPTYFFAMRHAYHGLFGILSIVGVALSLSSIPVFFKKNK